MGLTFWERMSQRYIRSVRGRYRYDPETVRLFMTNHRVREDSTIVAAERSVPAGAEEMIAGEMAALRGRARDARVGETIARTPWMRAAVFVALCFVFFWKSGRAALRDYERGQSWGGHLLMGIVSVAVFVFLWFALTRRTLFGVDPHVRACEDFAERLGGKAGNGTLDEVVAWLDARWKWFLPPQLGANLVVWAIGERRGVPVLVVLEKYNAALRSNVVSSFSLPTRRDQLPSGLWTRCNVFIHEARFSDAVHRERVQSTLQRMGGGVVQCPNGVYLYGTLAFMGSSREEGPTSEIWVDLVDQVIDPGFQGSPGAAKALQEELALIGLDLAKEIPHA
jgi:hypothetical protein